MRSIPTLCAATAMAVLLAWPAHAEMSAEQAGQAVAEAFDVEVLKVRVDTHAEARVYLVTVMTPGGNFNGAFQVATLMVDARTGRLVSQFRHLPSGYQLPGAQTYEESTGRPDAAQRGVVWR